MVSFSFFFSADHLIVKWFSYTGAFLGHNKENKFEYNMDAWLISTNCKVFKTRMGLIICQLKYFFNTKTHPELNFIYYSKHLSKFIFSETDQPLSSLPSLCFDYMAILKLTFGRFTPAEAKSPFLRLLRKTVRPRWAEPMNFMREKHAPYRTHDGGFCRCYFDEHFTASAVAYCVRAVLTWMSTTQVVRLISFRRLMSHMKDSWNSWKWSDTL